MAVETIVPEGLCFSTNEDVSCLVRGGRCQQQRMRRREGAKTHLPASSSENLTAVRRDKKEAIEGVHCVVWRRTGPAAGKSLAQRGERVLRAHAGGGVKSSDTESAARFTVPSWRRMAGFLCC